jgi:hypothetical protein
MHGVCDSRAPSFLQWNPVVTDAGDQVTSSSLPQWASKFFGFLAKLLNQRTTYADFGN